MPTWKFQIGDKVIAHDFDCCGGVRINGVIEEIYPNYGELAYKVVFTNPRTKKPDYFFFLGTQLELEPLEESF